MTDCLKATGERSCRGRRSTLNVIGSSSRSTLLKLLLALSNRCWLCGNITCTIATNHNDMTSEDNVYEGIEDCIVHWKDGLRFKMDETRLYKTLGLF